ncbi:MAG: LuxR family transcriptional regulator [Myxococcales bacterium]|nr:MAG: LuxR family transcriptional regulator [Myxococcales bacterium]
MLASHERLQLAALWDELVAGTTKIDGWSHTETTWSMVVSRRPDQDRPAHPLRRRDVAILEDALLSGVRKHVAVEVGLSCSSIAVIMQSCFHFMGLSCLPSRIPGLVVAAAHSRHHFGSAAPAYETALGAEQALRERTLTFNRPDKLLAAWLAPAEHAVIHLLIEGMTYAEIAEARRTSVRTVANQVASGFRRLDVSGRAELLCLLARWALEAPVPPAKRPPSIAPSGAKRSTARRSRARTERRSRPQSLSPSPAT